MKVIDFEAGSIAGQFSDDYVRDVEDEIGVQFPIGYLDLMRQANGGRPIQQYFLLDGNEKVVERFLSFVEDYKTSNWGVYDIEVVWSQIEDRLDEKICPFAALFAGDFLCFDGRLEGEPKIILWDHEKAAQGVPSLRFVADSFDEFSEMLRE